MYEIILNKKVKKFLKNHEQVARIFFKKIQLLHINPFSSRIDVKKLQGHKNKYRLRIGKYRFLYEIQEEEIIVYFYEADSRGNIY